MIVMKFGGTSVGDGKRILDAAKLIKNETRKKVVVVSAMGGVTDKLVGTAEKVVTLPATVVGEEVGRFHSDLLVLHESAAKNAISDEKVLNETLEGIRELLNELKFILMGIGYLEDLTPKSLDRVSSFGEQLSAPILSGALKSIGAESIHLTGYEAGIVTNSQFGQARPIPRILSRRIRPKLKGFIEDDITPVVTGFIAANVEAHITTLGRGGSDYTASIIAKYMGAEEVQIWTDVDGIFTTDPRWVAEAKLIPMLSYAEAMDLAYFGAKVVHPKTIEPAMESNIPVRVMNTFNPGTEGTLIVREEKKIEGVAKAVTMAGGVCVVNLHGVGMAETPNIAGRVFTLLGEHGINVVMISGASESNLSFIIGRDDVNDAVEALGGLMDGDIRNLEIHEDVCIITVVGAGMKGTKGIAAKIFSTVAEADVNIIMIAQGSSEVNISFVVEDKDGINALKAIHERFIK